MVRIVVFLRAYVRIACPFTSNIDASEAAVTGHWPTYLKILHRGKPKQLKFIQCGVCNIVVYTKNYYIYIYNNAQNTLLSYCSRTISFLFVFALLWSQCTFLFRFDHFVYRRKVIAPHSFNRIESAYSICVCPLSAVRCAKKCLAKNCINKKKKKKMDSHIAPTENVERKNVNLL